MNEKEIYIEQRTISGFEITKSGDDKYYIIIKSIESL